MTVRVKICGITTAKDAIAAVDAGADLLGFNFYPYSPRYIPPEACAQLLVMLRRERQRLPLLVGVFVNMDASEVAEIVETCALDYAQLSGDEAPESISALNGRCFKAIRPDDYHAALRLVAAYTTPSLHEYAPAVLLDASNTGLYGGSGRVADWSVASALAAEIPILLAGGLHPDNVAHAVAAVSPWGVDVASGVESSPGIKDASKMKTFIDRAKAAAQ